MSALLPVLVILVMVAVNALYVAAEFATVGSRRSRVQEAAENGNRAAVSLLDILKDPKRLDNYVAACQIGITLSSLVAGAYGQAQLTPLLTPYFGAAGQGVAVLLTLVLITALQVVLGELLPKTVALRYPERLALATLVPMQFSQWLFTPLIKLFNGTAFALMRAWKLNADHSHAHVHSPEELEGLYRESAAGGPDRRRRTRHARRGAERGGARGARNHDAAHPAGHGVPGPQSGRGAAPADRQSLLALSGDRRRRRRGGGSCICARCIWWPKPTRPRWSAPSCVSRWSWPRS